MLLVTIVLPRMPFPTRPSEILRDLSEFTWNIGISPLPGAVSVLRPELSPGPLSASSLLLDSVLPK